MPAVVVAFLGQRWLGFALWLTCTALTYWLFLSGFWFAMGAHHALREAGRPARISRWLNLVGLAVYLGLIARMLLTMGRLARHD